MTDIMNLQIYTDGSCLGNPGVGGWAFLILRDDGIISQFGSNIYTTNNIMEMTAVLEGMKYMIENNFDTASIHTDSNYVKQGITLWSKKWIVNNWKSSTGKPIKNIELWKNIINLNNQLNISWKWVKAHDIDKYNNMVDNIANNAAKQLKSSKDA